MEKIELVKGMTYLGIAVGKEYTSEECEVFYDFLKGNHSIPQRESEGRVFLILSSASAVFSCVPKAVKRT